MMNFDNKTNHKRVAAIQEKIDLIKTSAEKNSATTDQIWAMLEPALEDLSELLQAETERPEPQPPTQSGVGVAHKAIQQAIDLAEGGLYENAINHLIEYMGS